MAADRSKAAMAAAAARRIKSRGHPPPGDFIALGAKSRPIVPELPEIKPVSSQKLSGERKRDVPSSFTPPVKKAKFGSQTFTPLGRTSSGAGGSREVLETDTGTNPDAIAISVPSVELIDLVLESEGVGDDERIDGLLCGCIKSLRTNRAKPDITAYLSLMYLAKAKPVFFSSEVVIDALCSLLKRDIAMSFKSKGNSLVSVMACNVSLAAFVEEDNWPEQFIKVYIEDSLGERVWVDHPKCGDFVENLQTAFATKLPRKGDSMYGKEGLRYSSTTDLTAGASPAQSGDEESEVTSESGDTLIDKDPDLEIEISPRYTIIQESLASDVVDILKEHLTRRQSIDTGSRNMLKLLTTTCGIPEIRQMAAMRLEMWLQNPKLTKPAQDLLMAVCLNCNTHEHDDAEVIGHLIRIRLKTKPLINHYMACIRELLTQHTENLFTILKHTIYNELSNSRNPNNMSLLGVLFQHSPDNAAKYLAMVFQELLVNREDYIRAVRALLREIVRQLRYDLNFTSFCMGLMTERTEQQFAEMDSQLRDRLFLSLADLIALTELLSITPQVKDVVTACARGDRKDIEVLHAFQNQIAIIQRDSVWWLHTNVPAMFKPNQTDYVHCLQKVLFLEQNETYYNKDNWPPESERSLLLRLTAEVPVQEDTLMRVLVIGLSKNLPLTPAEALDMADKLVKRAAVLYTPDFSVLKVERCQLMDAVLNLCGYHHPENITLPAGYQAPQLAISNLYWKGWLLLLLVSAFNPKNIGHKSWEEYPMLKCFMEMCMTNNFNFPPSTMAPDERTTEELKARELQLAQIEKQDILEFESHLAAASTRMLIDESSSLLLAQLTSMDPHGVARKPPPHILEQLRSLNNTIKMGTLLCRSRSPDFLLDIIQRQGTSQSMPWLAELVESSEGSLDVLPVQCLCEFLLHDAPTEMEINMDDLSDEESKIEQHKKKQKLRKQEQLLARLKSLLHGEEAHTTAEILDYFLRRLSSQQQSARTLAAKGLSMVLDKHVKKHADSVSPKSSNHTDDSDDDVMIMDQEEEFGECPQYLESHKWLLHYLPRLPHFKAVQVQTCFHLRQACQMETDPSFISAYIIFLSRHAPLNQLHNMADLALDMAQLIVERPTILGYMIPKDDNQTERPTITLQSMLKIFYDYLKEATHPHAEAYSWSDTQDQVFIQWTTGEAATMHILVVHAMVILLTYGRPQGDSNFDYLLNAWFPSNQPSPSAFLVDTSEEALLLPDWLKLKMIRSHVSRLVDAALEDLEPAQLVLFVQSFGIPVNSMSKLLDHLDTACGQDSYSMEHVVADKGYMAQLVEVQQMRGSSGGNKFHQMLNKSLEKDKKDKNKDVEMSEVDVKEKIVTKKEYIGLPRDDSDAWQLLILKLFNIDQYHMTSQDEKQVLRTILQALSKEICQVSKTIPSIGDEVLQSMLTILQSSYANEFTNRLLNKRHLSCPIFNLLHRIQKSADHENEADDRFDRLISVVISVSKSKDNMFARYLKPSKSTSKDVNKSIIEICESDKLEKQTLKDLLDDLKTQGIVLSSLNMEKVYSRLAMCSSSELEEFLNAALSAPGKSTSHPTNELMSKLLLEQQTNKQDDISDRSGISTAGLLVDWLELLDPEIIQSCPDLQQQLLFTEKTQTGQNGSCCAYLLALLTHQTNWKTLRRCINWLLKPRQNINSINASIALDFLWACVHIPKIWQGRETNVPKKHSQEDVLCLTKEQICCMIDFVLTESRSKDNASVIQLRLALVINCCHGNKALITSVVEHLLANVTSNSCDSNTSLLLLLEIYLQVPELLHNIIDTNLLVRNCPTVSNSVSKFDVITHGLLSTLADTKSGRSCETKMNDANIALRKIAVAHPTLLLRQISMLSATLRGRVHLTFGEMKSRHHLLFFSHVLGILELMQPYLFQQDVDVLHSTLESYFELVREHGAQKLLAGLINKFLELLHMYCNYDQVQAGILLQKHSYILHDLCNCYPDSSILKTLIASTALPSRKQETQIPATDGEISHNIKDYSTSDNFTSSTMGAEWTHKDLLPLIRKLSKEQSVEVMMEGLHELDDISKRKVHILQHFVTDIMRIMIEKSDQCCNKAYTLAMRHIRHKPSSATEFLPAFMKCLDSHDHTIVNTALRNLPEFALLCQEHAGVVLQKAFSVGVNTSIDTAPIVAETLQLLNMESVTVAS